MWYYAPPFRGLQGIEVMHSRCSCRQKIASIVTDPVSHLSAASLHPAPATRAQATVLKRTKRLHMTSAPAVRLESRAPVLCAFSSLELQLWWDLLV